MSCSQGYVPLVDRNRNRQPTPGESRTGQVFKSKMGLILSCIGCVVGTGNLWRFPRMVAGNSSENGSLAFLVVWLLFLPLWSMPMLLIEYGTGRFTKLSVIGSMRRFIGDRAAWCGGWLCLTGFAIACYYSVIVGWCFYYVVRSVGFPLPTTDAESSQVFYAFSNSSWPVLTHALAVAVSGLCVSHGVHGIELANQALVPLLLLVVVFTFTWSLSRPFAGAGLAFLFSPDWSTLKNPSLWVDAISQNAFDTSAGMGLLIPYSTYMNRDHAIVRYSILLPAVNNFVSLICGMTVFSTAFSSLIARNPAITRPEILNVLGQAGPAFTGLTFIWMPVLFSDIGVFGRVLATLFFICLSCAGLSSLLSNSELVTQTIQNFGVKRVYAALLTSLLMFLGGLPSALSIDFLTNQDFVWGFALVVTGMMLQFMVMRFGVARFRLWVLNDFGLSDWKMPRFWDFLVAFVLPIEAVVLIVWWAIDLISSQSQTSPYWYHLNADTFLNTIMQWLATLTIAVLINAVWLKFCHRSTGRSSSYEVIPSSSERGDGCGEQRVSGDSENAAFVHDDDDEGVYQTIDKN